MKKNYVEFLSPGTFCSESSSFPIEKWDVKEAISILKEKNIKERYGAKPYGFRFSTWVEAENDVIVDGELLKLEPKKVESSGIYYLTGTVRSAQDVLNGNEERESILRSNVRCNGFNAVVENRNFYLSTFPFYPEDKVVNWDGEIIDDGQNYAPEAL
jgi:hypothetical protein